MNKLWLLLLLVLLPDCKWGKPGYLQINLQWETHTPGIHGKCRYTGVEASRYKVLDYRDDVVYTSGGLSDCEDFVEFHADGGEHEIEITGYYYDGADLVVGWQTVCGDMFVDGEDTPIFECEIPRVRDDNGQRERDY